MALLNPGGKHQNPNLDAPLPHSALLTWLIVRGSMFRLKLGKIWDGFYFQPIATTVSAHTVKISGDVAAVFHIEPEHNPRAGKPSLTWFALTRGRTVDPVTAM